MHNIKKLVAIISLLIISSTGIYFSGNSPEPTLKSTSNPTLIPTLNHSLNPSLNTNISAQSSEHNSGFNDIGQQASLASSMSRRNKTHINIPSSLHNTDPISLVHVDTDNQLILNHDIKVLFDYFFSSEGDLSPEELLSSMQQYIQQAYPQPAAQQALALLDKYLGYKQQMQDFHAQSSALQDLPELNTLTDSDRNTDKSNTLQTVETLMQERQNMREQVFTPAETDAMFGQDINYDQYMLTVAKLDSNLSTQERKVQIEHIAQQHLTAQQQEARKQTFILQHSPPNFSIDDNGECQGNSQEFTPQQVTALCQLAEKRRAHSLE